MRHKIFNILLYTSFLIAITSCKKIIDRENVQEVNTSNFYKTSIDAETGLTGCYNKTLGWDCYGKMAFMADISSDDIVAFDNNDDLFRLENRIQLRPDNGEVRGLWAGSYNALANINLMIEKVSEIPDNKFLLNRKKEIIAEGRFMRAYIYYYLSQLYGEVPLVLTFPKSASGEENFVKKNSLAEIMAQIKTDLVYAEANLPVNYNNPRNLPDINLINTKGRATKNAVRALELRILLFEKNWSEAAVKAQEIISSGQNKITEVKFVSVFRSNDGGQNTPESILETQSVELPGQFDNTGVLKFFYTGPPRFAATESAYTNYAAGSGIDVRKEQSMFKATNPTRIYAQKYKNYYSNEPNDNFIVFRYAEVLLNRAEALNELSYPNTEVIDVLNIIRARAKDPSFRFGACIGIAPITLVDVPTQTAMRQFIRDEKRRETTQEGLRWFDLLRWDNGDGALSAIGQTDKRRLLLPIPQVDRDRNTNLTQNSGY